MNNFLHRCEPYFYALLRIVSGFMFMTHGAQKLFNLPPSAKPMQLDAITTFGGVLEFALGAMIMLGLFAGFAAFIASGEMAVAYFTAHQPSGALPVQNGGDAAVLFCFLFFYIAARGSGLLSLDSLIFKRAPEAVNRT